MRVDNFESGSKLNAELRELQLTFVDDKSVVQLPLFSCGVGISG